MGKKRFGKLLVLGALAGGAAWVYKKYDTIKSMYHSVTIFNGKKFEFDEFDGEAIAAMFAGVDIDLREATFTEEEVYLDLYAFCGGVRVLLPSHVEAILEGEEKASGVQVSQDEESEKTVKLYINYKATASGILVTDDEELYVGGKTEEGCCCCEDDESCCEDDEPCCEDEEWNCNEEATPVEEPAKEEPVAPAVEEAPSFEPLEEVIEEVMIEEPVEDLMEESTPEVPVEKPEFEPKEEPKNDGFGLMDELPQDDDDFFE